MYSFLVDSIKLTTAFQLTSEDKVLQIPLSPTITASSSRGTFSDSLSATELFAMSDLILFVVTEGLLKINYKSLPFQPCLTATTKPNPYKEPSGPEVYSAPKELRQLDGHLLASVWDHSLFEGLCHVLNTTGVNWTSFDALCIAKVEEPSD
ncbi:uncharacterized protein PHACADRAFT_29227 [Phanerochaete carnosa HHB-10118-sp]|uniref:Uncharacterized protein n=1 Tax=Phanerochaete carnosa (strain HHB-10118-sp) TaxID=650164 RepID=K5VR43_PHACS|nr:uncharacterized protein PHACADRAFT_29227 [Phanerochaete carnosa HHB-10118-sp]EKM53933.1 hypothetical protein PHACADRAFT_29227 [Phanerochaete carnosa HHB-10118-sp]